MTGKKSHHIINLPDNDFMNAMPIGEEVCFKKALGQQGQSSVIQQREEDGGGPHCMGTEQDKKVLE